MNSFLWTTFAVFVNFKELQFFLLKNKKRKKKQFFFFSLLRDVAREHLLSPITPLPHFFSVFSLLRNVSGEHIRSLSPPPPTFCKISPPASTQGVYLLAFRLTVGSLGVLVVVATFAFYSAGVADLIYCQLANKNCKSYLSYFVLLFFVCCCRCCCCFLLLYWLVEQVIREPA